MSDIILYKVFLYKALNVIILIKCLTDSMFAPRSQIYISRFLRIFHCHEIFIRLILRKSTRSDRLPPFNPPTGTTAILIVAVFLFFQPDICSAKSLGWGRGNEYNTFQVVDNQGYVSIFEFLGHTPTRTKGRGIPLYATFNSGSENRSPYAGYGWKIDLLESRIIQQDANRYKVFLSNGRELIFVRDNKEKNRLISSKIWNGEIRGDTVTIKSKEQGWFQYQNGRLVSMKVDEGLYEYHYTQGNLTAINENGLPLLKIRKSKNEVRLVAFDGQSVIFNLTTRPRINLVDKKLEKTGDEPALGGVTTPSVTKKITYGLTPKNHPTITIDDRVISWSALDRTILTDGDWKYKVKPATHKLLNAEVSRVNGSGQKSFWYKDLMKGVETIERCDGFKSITKWFTSGILRNKTREFEYFMQGKPTQHTKHFYDEKGRRVRTLIKYFDGRDTQEYFFIFDDEKSPYSLAALVLNGELVEGRYTPRGAELARKYLTKQKDKNGE